MTELGTTLILVPVTLLLFAYFGYPAIMWLVVRLGSQPEPISDPVQWPEITITLPVFNEEHAIAATLDSLLALDYPVERRHILVISDASTDRTDQIVRGYSGRGVELVRLAERGGKTAAENAAARHVSGTIIVNTDATIRIVPSGLKSLVRVFEDPRIGLASGRDVSVGDEAREGIQGESGYVGYEMWVRSLETRAGSIVGASGCFYASRRELFDEAFPSELSRDFASALITVERGFRAVSVDQAVCLVPRARSPRAEYRRKVRTMTRGLETLWYKRRVVSVAGFLFGFQLLSHKVIRWLVFLMGPLVPIGLGLLAIEHQWARWAVAAGLFGGLLGATAFAWPGDRKPPKLLALAGFLVGSMTAGHVAWIKALRGDRHPFWEPTRRS